GGSRRAGGAGGHGGPPLRTSGVRGERLGARLSKGGTSGRARRPSPPDFWGTGRGARGEALDGRDERGGAGAVPPGLRVRGAGRGGGASTGRTSGRARRPSLRTSGEGGAGLGGRSRRAGRAGGRGGPPLRTSGEGRRARRASGRARRPSPPDFW